MKNLDITKILTIEDINNTNFSQFLSEDDDQWLKHIKYPVTQEELDRICILYNSCKEGTKLVDSMGDLYILKT